VALSIDTRDTHDRIHDLVWGGFHTKVQVEEVITEEYLDPDTLSDEDRAWISTEVPRQWAAKRDAEAGWPAQTEFDRLDAVFEKLRGEKYIALHNAGNTLSDGHDDVQEIWRAAGRFESGIRGCCFYHSQDLDRAVHSGKLNLAFSGGMIPEADQREENTRAVAHHVVGFLRAAGFTAEWNGDLHTRIEVDLGVWRKRAPDARVRQRST
jgi:hypothetical protein